MWLKITQVLGLGETNLASLGPNETGTEFALFFMVVVVAFITRLKETILTVLFF